MKSLSLKARPVVAIVLVMMMLLSLFLLNACGSKAGTGDSKTTESAEEIAGPKPTAVTAYEGIDVPEGITVVEAPEEPAATSSSNSDNSDVNVPDGITIVDAPNDASGSSGSGNSGYNGITIVDPPSGSGNSGYNGITIVDPPDGSGSGGNSGGSASGTTLRSGSFSGSNSGITITCSYYVVSAGPNTIQVTMSASLYSPSLSSKANPVTFTCGGQSGSVTAPSIQGSGTTNLGSKTFTLNLAQGQSSSINMGVSWLFNGTYSGKSIDSVSAFNTVYVSR